MRIRSAFLALTALLATACTTTLETTFVPFDATGWRVGHAKDAGRGVGTITEFVRQGESIDDWSELITIQLIEDLKGREADEAVAELFEDQVTDYAHVEHGVIESDEWSVLYEWSIHDSAPHPDQHEIARMIEGEQGVHRVAYVKKGPRLADEERSRWIQLLRNAYVVKGETPIRPRE